MSLFKFRTIGALRDGAYGVYSAQRALGYSHDSALTTAALYYADVTGHTFAGARSIVADYLRERRERSILGGTL